MKGSNKQFARYLDNEYNDYYLEAPDDDEEEYDFEETFKNIPNKNAKTNNPAQPQDNNKPNPQEQPKKPVPKKSRQPEFKANFTSEKTPLTNIQIKKFVNLLGQDAKNCFYNLKEIQLPDTQVIDLFKPLYTKFETVPVLFLSVVPNQAVYLWQVNRLCPYQKATNYMVLDSRAMTAETKLHISILLLAKIGQPQGEEIIDAKFAGQGKLIVRSKIGKGQMVIRLYKVKSFFPIARVNPFKLEVLATDEYSLKLVITVTNTPYKEYTITASLWKRKTTEEITAAKVANYNADNAAEDTPVEVETLLDTKTLENVPGNFDFQDSSFSEVFIVSNDLITLVDNDTSTVLSWKDTLISLNWLEIGMIQSAHLISNDSTSCAYLVTTENQVHELDLSQFPSMPITDKSDRASLNPFYLPGELQKIVQKSSEPYIFTPFNDSAMVFNFSDQKILLSPLGETEGHSMNMEVAQLEKELEKTKTFSWSVVGSRGNNKVLLHLWEHYLNFSYPFYPGSNTKSVELPFQETDKVKAWQILGVNGRAFLCGRFHNRPETAILEVRYDASSDPYQDFPVTVSKEEDGKTYEFSGEKLFCQVIGPGDDIVFIRFDNEPYYNDSLNMMYDVPISLVNPLGGKKSKGNADINQEDDEEKKEEERIEKINKLKNEVKHMKGHGRLEENKDKLKEVRAEIGSKIKDIKKFDEEFKKQQTENNHPNNKKKEDIKVMKVPKGVSKESLELYDEIKTEKKKIEKERGKEKTQRKKDRNFKNDM